MSKYLLPTELSYLSQDSNLTWPPAFKANTPHAEAAQYSIPICSPKPTSHKLNPDEQGIDLEKRQSGDCFNPQDTHKHKNSLVQRKYLVLYVHAYSCCMHVKSHTYMHIYIHTCAYM